jgi:Flp pilus assembly protein TadD
MPGTIRAALVAICIGLPLAGCQTTGASTNGADPIALGDDRHGNPVAGNNETLPWSNQASLKGDPSNRALEQGREAFRDANYGTSEKHFRQAVELRPDNAAAWLGLAASYDQLGRFDLADRAYDQLAKLKPKDARVLNNRGYSYLLRGDYKQARRLFDAALALDPSLEEVQGNLHLLEKVRQS